QELRLSAEDQKSLSGKKKKEKHLPETLNGLGFNKEMQAKKTRNFLENAYWFGTCSVYEPTFMNPPFCCLMDNGSLSLLLLKDA
nr:hypothetical protein [Tanacetum cinerariifolium]